MRKDPMSDQHFDDLEAKLRANRPEPASQLVKNIVRSTRQRPGASRARGSLAAVFVALVLSSTIAGAAFATKGGNGGGSNGNGIGGGGHPAACVEGNGKSQAQNPNC